MLQHRRPEVSSREGGGHVEDNQLVHRKAAIHQALPLIVRFPSKPAGRKAVTSSLSCARLQLIVLERHGRMLQASHSIQTPSAELVQPPRARTPPTKPGD